MERFCLFQGEGALTVGQEAQSPAVRGSVSWSPISTEGGRRGEGVAHHLTLSRLDSQTVSRSSPCSLPDTHIHFQELEEREEPTSVISSCPGP
jgi:hypothetical protein